MQQLVSTPLVDFLRGLRTEIDHNYGHGRVMVAVDGMAGSGAGDFADELARVYTETGRETFRASMEDFHRSRAERYQAGHTSPEGYYQDSYDYRTLRRVLIDPFRMAGSTGFQTSAFDVRRDAPVVTSWQTADADGILIIDGVFLLRPELIGTWNYAIAIDVPPALAYERLAKRDSRDPDPASPANARYIGGRELYLAEAAPLFAASAVVDNTDPAHPLRIFPDNGCGGA
ncbi:MAG TPA: uridine kinase [Microbacteriaceae bacterium]